MAINPDLVKVGDVLYDVRRKKMGNTTMSRSRLVWWKVDVLAVEAFDNETRKWVCSWNGNRPETYYRRDIARLRRSPPKTKR